MNDTQPPPQEHVTYSPSLWRARWYRCLRFVRDLFRRRNINQELKEQRWQGIQIGRAQYLGHCPYHEREVLQEVRRGQFSCFTCASEVYTHSLWMPELREPRTDPTQHILPATRYVNLRKTGAGPHTAMSRALPKYVTQPLKPKEQK